MKRRTYLAAVSSSLLLAGCNQQADPDQTTTPTKTTSSTTSTTTAPSTTTTSETTTAPSTTTTARSPALPKTVQISTDGPSYPGLAFSAELITDTYTESHPPRLTATLTNTGDTLLELELGSRPPFSKRNAETEQYLLLVPDDSYEHNQCWERPLETAIGEEQLITRKPLDAGESLAVTVELWDNHMTPECLPTGEFRFVNHFRIKESDDWHGTATTITAHINNTS